LDPAVYLNAVLPLWLLGLVLIGGGTVAGAAGLYLVRRRFKNPPFEGNDVAGFIYTNLGVVYAVLLAFIVIVVWQGFTDAERNAAEESAIIIALYRDTAIYPEPQRQLLREKLRAYTAAVAQDEWETMSRGQASLKARAALAELWQAYLGQKPSTLADSVLYTEASRRINDMSTRRTQRILSSSSSLSPILWFMLGAGGAVMIGSTYLFASRSVLSHAVMSGLLAGLVAASLLVIIALDHPFTGDFRVSSESFDHALAVFENRDAE
jgi:hypothetical protein